MLKMNMLFSFALGVLIGVAACETDQSEESLPEEQPIENDGGNVNKHRIETPEVVLQLKYDRGELNRIYLAQFRKGIKRWTPSVRARTNLCADLCHAGLGGHGCGATCHDLMPVGLQATLNASTTTSAIIGHPRYEVCPTLCRNELGDPLCNCRDVEMTEESDVDWSAICSAFCTSDRYVLSGCPVCEDTGTTISAVRALSMSRTLNTAEGWAAWCNVQCRAGQGGAACNCDRTPFQ